MSNEIKRNYGCKDEELFFMCGFAATSFKRDLVDFTTYSPKFNQAYLTGFEGNIASAKELILPRSIMLEQKTVTTRLHATLDALIEPLRHLTGYIHLAEKAVTTSVADFGFNALRISINSRDAEGAFMNLQLVNANVAKFKTVLTEQGLSVALIDGLIASAAAIDTDKQKQVELESNRKNLLQSNIGLFNELNGQFTDILALGKIIYKGKDPVKLKEYTYTELVKQVRRASKTESDNTSVVNNQNPVA